jgi:hypothetical protein
VPGTRRAPVPAERESERLLSLGYVYPFRCQACGYRFLALRWGRRYRRARFVGSSPTGCPGAPSAGRRDTAEARSAGAAAARPQGLGVLICSTAGGAFSSWIVV